jgi:hypothetical protein
MTARVKPPLPRRSPEKPITGAPAEEGKANCSFTASP